MALDQDGNSKNSPSAKPFDASDSFVKKIANRVTGLIGWQSNSYENAEDSNHEDLPSTPNPKRIKLHTSEPLNFPAKSATKDGCNITQSVNDSNVAGPSFKSKCLVASTPAFNYCVESPSQHTDMSTVTTYDFNKSLNETSTMMNKRRPSFNAEVFSASNKRLSLSVCESRNRSCLSPFYSARTLYGGASALLPYSSQSGAKLRAESTSNLNVFSPRNQITIQPVPSPNRGGGPNDQETMSAAARRILDTLERYCSPIKDAKRIPMNESSTRCEDDRTFPSRGIKRKLPSLTQITPSTTDLLRIKRQEKMQDSILNARQAVSTVPEPSTSAAAAADLDSSSDSTDLDYTVFNDNTRRKDDVKQVAKRKEENKYDDRPAETASVSKSGPNAVLNLANLPKYEITDSFTFSKPLTVENFDKVADEIEAKPSTSAASISVGKKPRNISGSEQRSNLNAPVLRTNSAEEFKSFMSSVSPSSRKTLGANEISSSTSVSKTNQQLSSKSNVFNNTATNKVLAAVGKVGDKWPCKNCMLVSNSDTCTSCTSQRPESGESSTTQADDKPLPNAAQSSATGSNDRSVSSKNSNKVDKLVVNNVMVGSGFGAFNDLDRNKSISGGDNAFSATKSNTKDNSKESLTSTVDGTDNLKSKDTIAASTTFNQSQPNDLWKNLTKPTDKWKCEVCMVQNDKTSGECVCCSTPNPQASTTDREKTAESSKPSFTFGIPAVNVESNSPAVQFGSSTTSVANTTKPAPSITFGFGNNATTVSTSATSSNTFSFGTPATVSNANTNALASYSFGVKKVENTTMSFGSSGAFASDTNKAVNDKVSASNQKTAESISFNDSTNAINNKKSPNPFLKLASEGSENALYSTKTNLVQKSIMGGTSPQVVRENGDDSQSSSSIFNDVDSSSMTTPMKKKPSGGFPLPPSLFGSKDGAASSTATPAQSISTTNAFGSSNGNVLNNNGFKLPSSSLINNNVSATVTSTPASQPGNLFSSSTFSQSTATLGGSKPNEGLSSFGSSAGTASSFGSMNSTPFASQPALFGNTSLAKKENSGLSAAATDNTNKAGSFTSGSTNSTFGHFNSIGSANATNTGTGKPAETAVTTPSLNFNNQTPSTATPFRFGASNTSTSTPQQNNSQSGAAGFSFNGPTKLDNSTMSSPPKYNAFGSSVMATPQTFAFGSTTPVAPAANSNATPFASVIKASSQDSILKPTPPMAFGAAALGGETIKKSGGFSFNAVNTMSTPSIGGFSGFPTPINDNQEQKAQFVFGSSANPPAPTHNFSTAIPQSFNFNSGATANSIPTFSATPQPTTTGTIPPRKFKKAVRRTAK